MAKLNKFYLANDPFDKEANSLIISFVYPKCIFEVFRENNLAKVNLIKEKHQCFFHINSNGHPENWVIILKDTFGNQDITYEDWNPIIKEAWDWFNSYLRQTYQNTKESERSKLN